LKRLAIFYTPARQRYFGSGGFIYLLTLPGSKYDTEKIAVNPGQVNLGLVFSRDGGVVLE
jgi:hypothetical protein